MSIDAPHHTFGKTCEMALIRPGSESVQIDFGIILSVAFTKHCKIHVYVEDNSSSTNAFAHFRIFHNYPLPLTHSNTYYTC